MLDIESEGEGARWPAPALENNTENNQRAPEHQKASGPPTLRRW